MEGGFAAAGAGRLRAFEVEIHHDSVLTASDDDSFTGLVSERIDLLVRYVGRNIDKVARPRFAAEFQVVSPSHTGPATNDVKDGFEFAVVMRSGLCVGLNYHRAGPQFARARSSVSDGCCASHAGSLGRVGVQIAGWNDLNAIV